VASVRLVDHDAVLEGPPRKAAYTGDRNAYLGRQTVPQPNGSLHRSGRDDWIYSKSRGAREPGSRPLQLPPCHGIACPEKRRLHPLASQPATGRTTRPPRIMAPWLTQNLGNVLGFRNMSQRSRLARNRQRWDHSARTRVCRYFGVVSVYYLWG